MSEDVITGLVVVGAAFACIAIYVYYKVVHAKEDEAKLERLAKNPKRGDWKAVWQCSQCSNVSEEKYAYLRCCPGCGDDASLENIEKRIRRHVYDGKSSYWEYKDEA